MMAKNTGESRFKRFVRAYIRVVQKILITILLVLLYTVGIGLTRLFATVFYRRILRDRPAAPDSSWEPAEDYTVDREGALLLS